jgi:hypothetical protein
MNVVFNEIVIYHDSSSTDVSGAFDLFDVSDDEQRLACRWTTWRGEVAETENDNINVQLHHLFCSKQIILLLLID